MRFGMKTRGHLRRWTPVPTFATPGDVSFTPTVQVGDWVRQGREVRATFRLAGTITHTTASGNLQVTGLPVAPTSDTSFIFDGVLVWGGLTLAAGYTQVACTLAAGSATILFSASGSAVAPVNVTEARVPTGGTLVLRGTLIYRI